MIIIDGIRYKESDARRRGLIKTKEGDATIARHKSVPAPRSGSAADAAKGETKGETKPRPSAK